MKRSRIEVTAFTGGTDVPGARFRVRQYIPALSANSIDVNEYPARFNCYPPKSHMMRPLWAVGALAQRTPGVIASHRGNVTLFQREMLSTMTTLEWLTKRPRVLDVDDAIWLHPRGAFARRLAESCDTVICGNSFLADQFRRWNESIHIIPTAVDTERYQPLEGGLPGSRPDIIGWSGTSSGLKLLKGIEPALSLVFKARPQARLRVLSDSPVSLPSISKGQIEFVHWSEAKEIEALRGMKIGIMPLDNSLWSLGKCSYKMLLYMSCAIPVVVSPLGMNAEVLKLGSSGFGPRNVKEWSEALVAMLDDPLNAGNMGRRGRSVVEKHFSIPIIAPHLATVLRNVS